jgi:RNA polymerase sigma-70 factor, ECF subfamily
LSFGALRLDFAAMTASDTNFHGDIVMRPIRANRQPAAAAYLRPHGAAEYRLTGIHVLRIEGSAIAEITTFFSALCAGFARPATIAA